MNPMRFPCQTSLNPRIQEVLVEHRQETLLAETDALAENTARRNPKCAARLAATQNTKVLQSMRQVELCFFDKQTEQGAEVRQLVDLGRAWLHLTRATSF